MQRAVSVAEANGIVSRSVPHIGTLYRNVNPYAHAGTLIQGINRRGAAEP